MSKVQPSKKFDPAFVIRKSFVSMFIVFTFVAYAIHEQLINPNGSAPANASARPMPNNSEANAPTDLSPTLAPTQYAPGVLLPTSMPTIAPTAVIPTVASGQYKDGQYTGSSANAYYGMVQVKTIIQGGKITDVQFLSWPSDRRTSQRINSQAMPYLTQEAIQAQNAQVDIISGATLTSRAFIQSLQSSLNSAKA